MSVARPGLAAPSHRRRAAGAWVALTLLVAWPGCATRAHESLPFYVEIEELEPGRFSVRWKIPKPAPEADLPSPVLPEECEQTSGDAVLDDGSAYMRERRYACRTSLAGRRVQLAFGDWNPTGPILFRFESLRESPASGIVDSSTGEWTIPSGPDALAVAADYTVLGIRHILEGIDHLLFLVCLLVIARTGRRILVTVTGFTIAHSVTLALSTLDVVRLPIPPVEAAIALSIVALATEIASPSRDGLTYRYPIAASASFGLLHGFGLASVLIEVGLPRDAIPLALAFFNVGVEVGQIAVAGALLLITAVAAAAWKRSRPRSTLVLTRRHEVLASYLVGTLAAYWLIERIAAFARG